MGILQKKFIYLFPWQISNFYIGNIWGKLFALLLTASETSDAAAVLTGTSTPPFLMGKCVRTVNVMEAAEFTEASYH